MQLIQSFIFTVISDLHERSTNEENPEFDDENNGYWQRKPLSWIVGFTVPTKQCSRFECSIFQKNRKTRLLDSRWNLNCVKISLNVLKCFKSISKRSKMHNIADKSSRALSSKLISFFRKQQELWDALNSEFSPDLQKMFWALCQSVNYLSECCEVVIDCVCISRR